MIFFELFYTFFLIGLFTFGGGYAMIPMIQEQVVGKGWLESEALTDFIAISEKYKPIKLMSICHCFNTISNKFS